MKKVFFLIVLAIMVLTFINAQTAQQQQRLTQLEQELNQLAADLEAGRITVAQFQRRGTEIQTEMQNIYNQANTAQQQAQNTGTTFSQTQLQRIEQLLDQSKTLEADRHNGRINQTQYDRQINTINQELQSIYNTVTSPMARTQLNEVEQRINAIWPGAQPGWPTSQDWNMLNEKFGCGSYTQSRGTKASFTINYSQTRGLSDFRVIQTGGNQDTVFREIKNQIERNTRGKVLKITDNNDYYGVEIIMPGSVPDNNGWYFIVGISVRKDNNSVMLSVGTINENTNNRTFGQ